MTCSTDTLTKWIGEGVHVYTVDVPHFITAGPSGDLLYKYSLD